MKVIKYKVLGYLGNYNQETREVEQVECFAGVERPYSVDNEEIAKVEAYNGEYEIYDDGKPEAVQTPEQRIAELEEALELLLTGVTE